MRRDGEPGDLPTEQLERFQRQRLSLGGVLDDALLTEEAFRDLIEIGSSAGFYLRARAMAPEKPNQGEIAAEGDRERAAKAAAYLREHYTLIAADPRCVSLLLNMEWVAEVGRWLFRGTRQPLPSAELTLNRIHGVLQDYLVASDSNVTSKYRYLDSVLSWLIGNESTALANWRQLAHDTEYIEQGRVLNRHTITNVSGDPVTYSGGYRNQRLEGWRRLRSLFEDADAARIALKRAIRQELLHQFGWAEEV
jgi:hypothetical protein